MHSTTVALDSLPPTLLTFSDLLLLFLFVLSKKFSLSTLCTSDISSQWHLNCHSASFLIEVRRALPARSQREQGDRRVFTCQSAQPNQNTTWSKIVSPLTFKVHSSLVGLIRCGWKYRWVKYPTSQAVSRKANSYSLMYPPPSSLTIPRGSRIS